MIFISIILKQNQKTYSEISSSLSYELRRIIVDSMLYAILGHKPDKNSFPIPSSFIIFLGSSSTLSYLKDRWEAALMKHT